MLSYEHFHSRTDKVNYCNNFHNSFVLSMQSVALSWASIEKVAGENFG